MAKPVAEILFSLAAQATAVQQSENQEQKNPAEILGPPPEDSSSKLIHQNGYYIKETSHAPRLSLEEQLQLEQTLIQNAALSLASSGDVNQHNLHHKK